MLECPQHSFEVPWGHHWWLNSHCLLMSTPCSYHASEGGGGFSLVRLLLQQVQDMLWCGNKEAHLTDFAPRGKLAPTKGICRTGQWCRWRLQCLDDWIWQAWGPERCSFSCSAGIVALAAFCYYRICVVLICLREVRKSSDTEAVRMNLNTFFKHLNVCISCRIYKKETKTYNVSEQFHKMC